MGSPYFTWAIVLIAIAVILFILEVLIPSGGIIGIFAACTLIAGIVMLFKVNTTAGLVGAIVTTAAIPFLFVIALRAWPHTPFAKMLVLEDSARADDEQSEPAVKEPHPLEGMKGKAVTDLRPVGTCLIDGKKEQCLAEGGMIEAGTPVRVTSASGMQIKVRADETT